MPFVVLVVVWTASFARADRPLKVGPYSLNQMTFTTIDSGQHSEIDEPREVVVRTAKEWTALWKEHGAQKPAPKIDFARSMVVGVFLGSRPTGGYAVDITRIERDGKNLVVIYRERRPDPQAMVAQIITTPFHLVQVNRHDGQVRFQRPQR
jgi:hypothetical protein